MMDNELLQQLKKIQKRDIETRNKLLKEGRLYGQYDQEMQDVHIENANALNDIIVKHGWPTISKVGAEGARLAWLIAQHSICTPNLQRTFFNSLSEAARNGDATQKQVALLLDRIRFNEGRPQIYGTIYDWDELGAFTCTVDNPRKVEELRKAVGLPPFYEALEEAKKQVKSEGGKPPKSHKKYRKQVEDWAKEVGWR